MSGAIGSGVALSSLGLDLTALKAHAAGLGKMGPDPRRQAVDNHLLLLFGGPRPDLQHRPVDRQDLQYRRRPVSPDQRGFARRQGRRTFWSDRGQRSSAAQGALPSAKERQMGGKRLELDTERRLSGDGAHQHRSPGPGLTQPLRSGSGRVVWPGFDDQPLYRFKEQ